MGRDPLTATSTTSATARFVATHSVLTLDARHPFAVKSLIDAQDMHRTVMSGFRGWVQGGSPDARAQMGILSTWSVDLKAAALVLVVQSRVPGDWSAIPAAAFTGDPRILTVDRTFRTGERLSFRTVVNPTHSIPVTASDGTPVRGRRSAHSTPHHVTRWFERRLQRADEPRLAPDGVVRIGVTADPETLGVRMLPKVSSPAPHRGLCISRAEIRGPLTVTDPGALVQAMTEGVGRGRAYGCGLLLVR